MLTVLSTPRLIVAGGSALLQGSFNMLSHTALYAIDDAVVDHTACWQRLGPMDAAHGQEMILGALLSGLVTGSPP